MPYTVFVSSEARQDILNAYLFYEAEQSELGDRFLTNVQECFAILSENPQYFSFIDNKKILRDLTVRTFQFVIVYEVIESEVTIYGVCSTYMKPRH